MTALRKILLIEDEPAVSQVVTWCLEDWPGTEVECAQNGTTAAEKIRSCQYGLAIIDGRLPGAFGLELAELAVERNIPVLLTTGHPDLAIKLDEIGFPCLPKPFALTSLLLKSQAVIAESQDNIRRVRASLETLKSRGEALKDALNRSNLLVEEAAIIVQNAKNDA
jgi:DNA-binding response OmpR family regulator